MGHIITESDIEEATLEIVEELGYDIIYGPDIAPDGPNPERAEYSDVVLVKRLKAAIENYNPRASRAAKDEALKKILGSERESPDLVVNNNAFYDMLVNGVDVEIGGLFTDFFARPNKRGGAWMDVCCNHSALGNKRQLPVAHLVCNFNAPFGDTPSLLTHNEVVTLFHEFGHSIHHLLTEVNWPSLAGINGVAWDAVELPSQFLENFA